MNVNRWLNVLIGVFAICLIMLRGECNAAEIVVIMEASGGYEKGDIIHAYNDRKIQDMHAQRICSLEKERELAEIYLAGVKQYKFVRTGAGTVDRINQWTGTTNSLSATPNGAGEYIDVPMYIARRKARSNHKIFGSVGAEVWYGGGTRADAAAITKVWTEIEARTPHRKTDYSALQYSRPTLKKYAVVKIQDVTDAAANALEAPLFSANGEIQKARKNQLDLVKAPVSKGDNRGGKTYDVSSVKKVKAAQL